MTAIPYVNIADGLEIPALGIGTFPLSNGEVVAQLGMALRTGFRLIDTAYKYNNEEGVGEAIRASGIPRDELFITTKLNGEFQRDHSRHASLEGSLQRLGLDYVDLVLIHWPLPGLDLYVETWRSFEEWLRRGQTRAIGVSNFKIAHLKRLIDETSTKPMVNQIQLSPEFQRTELREFMRARHVTAQAWGPLGRGRLFGHPAVTALAHAHGRTPAQIVLRWHVQQGIIPVPRTVRPDRMRENLDVFDFSLGESDMVSLSGLDRGEAAVVPDSDTEGH